MGDREKLEEELHKSTAAVEKAVSGLPDDAASQKAPGGWSILDCIEHIALVDRGFSGRIAVAERVAEPTFNPRRAELIIRDTPLRKTRFSAPPQVLPQGKYRDGE